MKRIEWPTPTLADLIAGLSVALVLIPQSLAYAQIAEMPVVTGLFAAALPLIVFALFASSPYLQTGPVALTSLLTLAALQGAGYASDHPDYVKLGALLALIVGIARLLLGLLRLGWLAYLICEPVRKGFTSAAALIIISSQLPKALGASLQAPDGSTIGRALWSITHPGAWTSGALVLSVMTLAVMLGGRKIHRLFPGVAVAVVLGMAYSGLLNDGVLTVGDTNPIPEGLPSLSLDLPWSSFGSLAVGGLIIALVGFAEPASIARQFAQEDKATWDANRELASSGLANMTAALSGTFPVGGSFSRSSVNRLAGAETRWSGGITGMAVLGFLSFASILDGLPQAVLGAIVVGAVLGLVKPIALIQMWRHSKPEAFLAWATFAATLALTPAVQWAVILGVALTAIVHVTRPLKLTDTGQDQDQDRDSDQNPDRDSDQNPDRGSEQSTKQNCGETTVRADGLLWLGSYGSFEKQLRLTALNDPHTNLVVDLGPDFVLDPRVEAIIDSLRDELADSGRSLSIAGTA